MLFRFHSNKMGTLGFVDDESIDYDITEAKLKEYREELTKTLKLTIKKNVDSQNIITTAGYISFVYKNVKYRFSITSFEETLEEIEVTAEYYSFEMLNEDVGKYENQPSRKLTDHLQAMEYYSADFKIGINEVANQSIQLTYTAYESRLKRLVSVISNFGAIGRFRIAEDADGNYKQLILDIFKEENFGRERNDVIITDEDLDSFSYTCDMTDFYTMLTPYGKDGLALVGDQVWLDADGNAEFSRRGSAMYAVQAAQKYPSDAENDIWIRQRVDIDTDSREKLASEGLKLLKAHSKPKESISAKGDFRDLEIGDTVTINIKKAGGSGFLGKMDVSSKETNLLTDEVEAEFSNFTRIDSAISANSLFIQSSQIANPVFSADLVTDNGTSFKNGVGSTTLSFIHRKDGQQSDYLRCEWYVGETIKSLDPTFTVNASDLVNNQLVVRLVIKSNSTVEIIKEITLTNVSDGKPGEDGKDAKIIQRSLIATNYVTSNEEIFLKNGTQSATLGSGRYWVIKTNLSSITEPVTFTSRLKNIENTSGKLSIGLCLPNNAGANEQLQDFEIKGDQIIAPFLAPSDSRKTAILVYANSGKWDGSANGQVIYYNYSVKKTSELEQEIANTRELTEVNASPEGIISTPETVVTGNTVATMIASDPTWAQKIGDKILVKDDMIVDGTITADKLKVDNLSAINSNLGNITGGSILLSNQRTNAAGDNLSENFNMNGALHWQQVNSTKQTITNFKIENGSGITIQESEIIGGKSLYSLALTKTGISATVANHADASWGRWGLTFNGAYTYMYADYIRQGTVFSLTNVPFPYALKGHFKRIGDMVTLNINRQIISLGSGEYAVMNEKVPEGFRPATEYCMPLFANSGPGVVNNALLYIGTDGTIRLTNNQTNRLVWSGSATWITPNTVPENYGVTNQ
ncbi:hypothetical protein [Streptococcus ferus]|uniref:hypothetical protein n=1 Tax=Streptococcus ferus TaxID=1345 RepID=UPI00359FC317